MKKVAAYRSVSIIFTILGCLSGCSKNDSVSPVEMKPFSDRVFGSIPLGVEKTVRLVNPLGGALIYGYEQEKINTYLFRTADAPDLQSGQARLDAMRLVYRSAGDTLFTAVRPDTPAGAVDCSCWATLNVPYMLNCVLDSVAQQIRVYYLSGTLLVRNGNAGVEVDSHSGNLSIKTSKGDVAIEAALPNSGFCRVGTGSGNIIVRIPQSTSATVRAFARNGVVGFSNLSWTSVVQHADSLSGVLAEGHGEIVLESKKGNIELIGF